MIATCEVTQRLEIAAAIQTNPKTLTVRASYGEDWPVCPVIDGKRCLFVRQRAAVDGWLLTYRVQGGGM